MAIKKQRPPVHVQPIELLKFWEQGVGYFNEGLYFEAHEQWENGWIRLPSPEKEYVQALIQLCAVIYHLERNNVQPALKLTDLALKKLSFVKLQTNLEFMTPRVSIPNLEKYLSDIKNQALQSQNDSSIWANRARELKAEVISA